MNYNKRRFIVNEASDFNEKLFSFDDNYLRGFLPPEVLTG
jgi:hypothetical protein